MVSSDGRVLTLGVTQIWLWILLLSHTNCVTSARLPNLSEPRIPHLWRGYIVHQACNKSGIWEPSFLSWASEPTRTGITFFISQSLLRMRGHWKWGGQWGLWRSAHSGGHAFFGSKISGTPILCKAHLAFFWNIHKSLSLVIFPNLVSVGFLCSNRLPLVILALFSFISRAQSHTPPLWNSFSVIPLEAPQQGEQSPKSSLLLHVYLHHLIVGQGL